MPRPRLYSLFPNIVALALLSAPAAAQSKEEQKALALSKEAIDQHYLALEMDKAIAKLRLALKTCGQKCSPKVVAELHRDLGVVYIAGMNQERQGENEFKQALAADPEIRLNPDLATPEVKAAFEKVGGQVRAEPKPPSEVGKIVLEEEVEVESEDQQLDSGLPRHWVSLALQQDVLFHSETPGACPSVTTPGAGGYVCKLSNGNTYGFRGEEGIDPGQYHNTVQGGMDLATQRVLVGYDYTVTPNLLAGARLGLAWGGAPADSAAKEAGFFPWHLELRGQYYFPYRLDQNEWRPYGAIAFGLMQIDSFVPVEFFAVSDPNHLGQKYTLYAWKKAGRPFLGIAGGGEYDVNEDITAFGELEFVHLFGSSGNALALRLGARYALDL